MVDPLIKLASLDDLREASDLCLRSKGHWGYDATFLEACRDELSINSCALETGLVAIAWQRGQMAGVVQIDFKDNEAELDKLFVDPPFIGQGIGTLLWRWAIEQISNRHANKLTIIADPQAEAFYLNQGAKCTGEINSGSIAGRMLPMLELDLTANP